MKREIDKKKPKFNFFVKKAPMDTLFLVLVIALLIMGLIMVFSASYATAYFKMKDSYFYIKKQAMFAGLGLIAMYFLSKINYNFLRILALPAYIISIITLVLVMAMGSDAKGAGRWLDLGFARFQPSEVAKLGLILFLALFISVNYNKMHKFVNGILYPAGIIGVMAVLIVIEPHLSGTLLICSIGFCMMIVGGANLKFIGILGAIGGAAAIFVVSNFSYMQDRIQTWLHPELDPLGKGFQTMQSLYAIGSGGFFGLGLGKSRQKYLYIPEPQNDFIFSIICEELGFIGAFLIMAVIAFLCYRGFVIAWGAPDKFGALLVVGIIVQVAVQTLLNIAVVTNAIPPTGISLPFFSYGGTALTMLLAEMGIVLSVSRQSRLKKE
ncbi:MAG: putative lipid II flippase FtsW [Clostridia bacterium]